MMPTYQTNLQRGGLYWAQMPYIPQPPLQVLEQANQQELQAAITFKVRPVLIVQNDRDNRQSAYPLVMVAAVHSIKQGEIEKLRQMNYPTDFLLTPPEGGLKRPSVVFLNQVQTLHKHLIQDKIGSLSQMRLDELNAKLGIAIGIIS